ncbi:MAG: phBC6A51 family helix-turn-helix protein [Patescibacteria group bacterium]
MGKADRAEGSESTMKTMSQKEEVLEILRRTPIVATACQKCGISRATLYRWKQESKTFAQQVDKALAEGCDLINDLAESQLLTAIKNQNLTSIMFWLRNRHSSYAEKLQVMAQVEHKNATLTPAQRAIIKKAFTLAGIYKNKLIGGKNVGSK